MVTEADVDAAFKELSRSWERESENDRAKMWKWFNEEMSRQAKQDDNRSRMMKEHHENMRKIRESNRDAMKSADEQLKRADQALREARR